VYEMGAKEVKRHGEPKFRDVGAPTFHLNL